MICNVHKHVPVLHFTFGTRTALHELQAIVLDSQLLLSSVLSQHPHSACISSSDIYDNLKFTDSVGGYSQQVLLETNAMRQPWPIRGGEGGTYPLVPKKRKGPAFQSGLKG